MLLSEKMRDEAQDKKKIEIPIETVVPAELVSFNRNENLVFYYDESNNLGKLWIKANKTGELGFNADIDNNFIIAGIAYDSFRRINIDRSALWKRLGLSFQVNELKFSKQFSEGDFLKTIAKKRMTEFLRWVDENDCYIHVANINFFYYAVTDIIDSVITINDIYPLCSSASDVYRKYMELKEALYRVLHHNISDVERLFSRFGYPNIKESEQVAFFDALIQMINAEANNSKDLLFIVEKMEQEKNGELVFLKDNRDYILVDGLELFYMHLYCLFPKSNHIFDKENLVRKELQKVDVICNGEVLKNYLFKDSKDDMLIQISDVIAGLWAQMNTYVNKKTDEEIRQDITKLSTVQLENLSLLWGLQLKSSIRNQGFFFSIAPVSDRERIIKMMLQAYQHPHGIKNI